MSSRLPRLSFTTTLSQPGRDWRGAVGRVSLLVETRVTSVADLEVFPCGNAAMIHDVRAFIRGKGLCPIRTEEYYDDLAEAGRAADASSAS